MCVRMYVYAPNPVQLHWHCSTLDPILSLMSLFLRWNIGSVIPTHLLTCEVSQDFVIRLLLFIRNINPLGSLIKTFSVDHHLHADDTQNIDLFSLNCFTDSIDLLLQCEYQHLFLCLNPSKINFILQEDSWSFYFSQRVPPMHSL